MRQKRWVGFIVVSALASTLALGACTSPTHNQTGRMSFRFASPQYNQSQFRIQAIPADTERFEITITGLGLTEARTASVEANGEASSQTHTISELPIGSKTVRVQAYNGETVLAEDTTTVRIVAGATVNAELELKPVSPEPSPSAEIGDGQVRFTLEKALPVAIRVGLQISGEGLNSPKEHAFEMAAGSTAEALESLPPGPKTVKVTLSANAQGQQITGNTDTLEFTVDEKGGGQINYAIDNFLASFRGQLSGLIANLTPLELFGLINSIGAERLNEVFSQLPPAVQNSIRNNPALAELLDPDVLNPPEPEASASPDASAPPAAEASAEPTPEASAETPVEAGILARVRLLSLAPASDLQELASNISDTDSDTDPEDINLVPVAKTLLPSFMRTIRRAYGWGLLLVSGFEVSDTETPPSLNYKIQITHLSIPPKNVFDSSGSINNFARVNNKAVVAGFVPFKNGELVELPQGLYSVFVRLEDPVSGENRQETYTFRVPDTAQNISAVN